MKRNIFAILLIISINISVFATTYKAITSKSFEIQGGVGEFASIEFSTIPSQSGSYMEGVPFNIEEDYVDFEKTSGSYGRRIATWSVLANTKFKIEIELGDFSTTATVGDTTYYPSLGYYLMFDYSLTYNTVGSDSTTVDSSYFWIKKTSKLYHYNDGQLTSYTPAGETSAEYGIGSMTGTQYEGTATIDLFENIEDFSGFAGIVNGNIFFKFTEGVSNVIFRGLGTSLTDLKEKNNRFNSTVEVPAGNYNATVNIRLIVEE